MSAKASTATKQAKKARQASDVNEFKKRSKGFPLKLPSGLTMMCQRVSLRNFLGGGDVPNPLMEIVQETLDKGGKMDVSQMLPEDGKPVNMEMINDMYSMLETLVIAASVSPKVHAVPEDEADRDDELLYVDEVDEEDKMFIFQWAIGGTDDVARFREEAAADLDVVAQGEGNKPKTKSAPRLGV